MELSPPALTRSPTPIRNSYCRSERSSIDYQSPILIQQHYKLSATYSEPQLCTTMAAQPIESDHNLPSVESMAPAGWHSSTVIHPVPASGPMQAILSPNYDTYNNYVSSMQPSYAHHQHTPHNPYHLQQQQQHSHMIHPSPVTPPLQEHPASPRTRPGTAARSPLPQLQQPHVYSLASTHESPNPMSARMTDSYSSSPRSVHDSYMAEPAMYTPGPSQTYMTEPPASSVWSKAEFNSPPPPPAVLYTTGPVGAQLDDHQQQQQQQQQAGLTPSLQDAQRVFKLTARPTPKRQPRRMTTREEANFQCDIKGCGKLFSRSYNYKAHLLTHDEKREFPFPCLLDGCSKRFVRKTDLQRHNQSVHLKERTHKCDYCSRLFARKDTLRR